MLRNIFLIIFFVSHLSKVLAGNKYVAHSKDELKAYVNSLLPGDTLELANGQYELGYITIAGINGTAEEPIVIKSQAVGGAVLTGKSYFTLRKISHVILMGFDFRSESGTVIKLEACNHVRITRNFFRLNETKSAKWIIVGGKWDEPYATSSHNRIDHNLFENKTQPGNFITLDGTPKPTSIPSKYDRIDHNYFRNNKPRVVNEKESVRLGQSELSWDSGFTVVEYNLFEECDGDPEIISVKTSEDTIRFNTFIRSKGTLCLRQTKNSVVYGNYFLGYNVDSTGGIRMYGYGHKIYNNYFQDLQGEKWDAAITITNGDVENTSTSYSSHMRPENIIVCFNSFINVEHPVEIGYTNNDSYKKAPRNITFSNNLVVSNGTNPIIKIISKPEGLLLENNAFAVLDSLYVGVPFTKNEIELIDDPSLVMNDGVYQISEKSPTVNKGNNHYPFVNYDIEGQQRDTMPDIGADELSMFPKSNYLLTPDKVGPYAAEDDIETSVREYDVPSHDFELMNNYPNPFNSTTNIVFIVNKKGLYILKIYDILGREVATLQNKELLPGKYTVQFIADKIASGNYFCKIEGPSGHKVLKIVYLK